MDKEQLSVGARVESLSQVTQQWLPAVIIDVRRFGVDQLVQVEITNPNGQRHCALRHLNDIRLPGS